MTYGPKANAVSRANPPARPSPPSQRPANGDSSSKGRRARQVRTSGIGASERAARRPTFSLAGYMADSHR